MNFETHHLALIHRITEYIERDRARQLLEVKEQIVGVEIGVDRGDLSESLLRVFPNLHLHMVDPWQVYAHDTRYRQTGDSRARRSRRKWSRVLAQVKARTEFAEHRVTFHQMPSCQAVLDPIFESNSLDFVFVDGDHSFEGCLEDIRLWLPKVKTNGVFGGHDWDNPRCGSIRDGVERAVGTAFQERDPNLIQSVDLDCGMTWFFRSPHR